MQTVYGEVYVLTAIPYVAQIGETKYETLEEAIATGGEITMLTDYEIKESIEVTNTVVLDLNGKKITAPDDGKENWYGFIVDGGDMTLTDSVGTGELYAKCYGIETRSGSFTLDGAKITATNNKKLGTAVVNYGGTVTINSGTAEGIYHAVYTSGYFSDASTSITGGTITGTVGMKDKVDENSGDYTESVASASGTQDAADGYEWVKDGEVYVLTAIPVPSYTIAFNANGGSVTPASAVTNAEGKLTSLPTPTRSGSYSFNG